MLTYFKKRCRKSTNRGWKLEEFNRKCALSLINNDNYTDKCVKKKKNPCTLRIGPVLLRRRGRHGSGSVPRIKSTPDVGNPSRNKPTH